VLAAGERAAFPCHRASVGGDQVWPNAAEVEILARAWTEAVVEP
jgi:hypothetical protein